MTRAIKSNSLLAFPTQGRKSLPLTLDHTTLASVETNLTTEIIEPGVLDLVQGVYIDNADNANPITLTFPGPGAGFRVKCPANAQMTMPVPIAPGPFTFKSETTVGVSVNIELFNVPLAPCVWPSATVANVTANVAPTQAAFTNRNKLLTGGADPVMGANLVRKYLFLKNRVSNIGQITVNFAGGASFILAPGETYQSIFVVNDEAITATGTAGDTLEASEA